MVLLTCHVIDPYPTVSRSGGQGICKFSLVSQIYIFISYKGNCVSSFPGYSAPVQLFFLRGGGGEGRWGGGGGRGGPGVTY